MRKLIVTNIVSLDGYYEGPGRNVMVLPMDHSFDAYNAERLRAADTLLFGSRALWNDLLTAGLVDKLHLIVGPVVVGGGTPAFGNAPAAPFRLLDTRMWEGSNNVLFQYAAAGQAA